MGMALLWGENRKSRFVRTGFLHANIFIISQILSACKEKSFDLLKNLCFIQRKAKTFCYPANCNRGKSVVRWNQKRGRRYKPMRK